MNAPGPEAMFWSHLADGRFMIQYYKSNASYSLYPRVAAPATGDTDVEWREASGDGTVYSVTIVRPRPPSLPYAVALIDLAEGPRMMSSVEGIDPENVRIGMPVRARIVERQARAVVVFEPS
jgi:uncharacterized OB-fold protein